MREETDYSECVNFFRNDDKIEFRLFDIDQKRIVFVIIGPNNTPFKGGFFYFELIFPPNYPFIPPYIYCHTRIWHPCIDCSARPGQTNINLDLVNPVLINTRSGWRPSKVLQNIIINLMELFNLRQRSIKWINVINFEAGEQYSENKDKFIAKARSFTNSYALQNQEISISPKPRFFNYFDVHGFKWDYDIDASIYDLKRRYTSFNLSKGLAIQLLYKGKIIPDDLKFKDLTYHHGKDRIRVMETFAGRDPNSYIIDC
ncbi:hypothetical protein ES703_102109 [subsurface metagenome]